jgi:hypothetical protein
MFPENQYCLEKSFNLELTSGGLIAKALQKAHNVVNSEIVPKTPALAI